MCACWCCVNSEGGHSSAANGYTITGHGHYRGYSRVMWPHIITIDAQFAVWMCVRVLLSLLCTHKVCFRLDLHFESYSANNEAGNVRRSSESANVALKLKLKVEHGANNTSDGADW